jgi:hypothetical protein
MGFDITSWDSEGMDWTDPQSDQAKYIEAYRLAIIERCLASGAFIPSVLFKPIYENRGKLILDKSFLDTCKDKVKAIAPEFVNHTINGGDFTGEIEILNWTFDDILKETGDNQYYQPQSNVLNNNRFLKQQYDILNLLRWEKYSGTINDAQKRESTESSTIKHPTANEAWSSAYETFDSSWIDISFSGIFSAGEMYRSNESSYHAYLSIWRSNFKRIFNFTHGYQASVDIYGFASKPSDSSDVFYYFDTNSGWTENTYNFIETINETTLDTILSSGIITPPSPSQPPTPTEDDTITSNQARLSNPMFIAKFDGPNGFQFLDTDEE